MNKTPPFYIENDIPKVRWMFPGNCYKARYKSVPYKYPQGIMFIYVVNVQHVIAFKDSAMTQEIGMLKLEHFEKIQDLTRAATPRYKSTFPINLTYDLLIDKLKDLSESVHITILPPDPPEEQEQLTLF